MELLCNFNIPNIIFTWGTWLHFFSLCWNCFTLQKNPWDLQLWFLWVWASYRECFAYSWKTCEKAYLI